MRVRLFRGSSGVVKLSRGLGQWGYSLPARTWVVVAWKELLEALRDRRTMINVVLLPMIMMPLVISLPTLMLSPKAIPPKIMVVVSDEGAMDLAQQIKSLESSSQAQVSIVTGEGDFSNLILNGEVDLVVEIPKGFLRNITEGRSGTIVYYYDPYGARSSVAIGVVQGIVNGYSYTILKERLKAINLSEEYIRPITTIAKQVTAGGGEVSTGEVLTAIVIPMMVGLIAITGAGTFAIDMIAGERERKTIEALLTNPVTRGQVLCGKFLALTALALISGISTVLSSIVGVGIAVSSVEESIAHVQAIQLIDPSKIGYFIVGILLTIALGGLTGNAIMVTAASFAKSFKEAQQYIGFLTLILVVPMVAIPYAPQSLYPYLRLMPISSLAMFARDMIVNPGELTAVFTSLVVSLIYLMVFLWLSSKMFARESVVFG